eukprot:1143692-Pelagomonas_calceolata.AAC.1
MAIEVAVLLLGGLELVLEAKRSSQYLTSTLVPQFWKELTRECRNQLAAANQPTVKTVAEAWLGVNVIARARA